MSLMSLNTTTLGTKSFTWNPTENASLEKEKTVLSTPTYSSSQLDDYGFLSPAAGLIGSEWALAWEIMTLAEYDLLWDYYENAADEDITWDPQEWAHATDYTYKVKIPEMSPLGRMHRLGTYVLGVRMVMNIREAIAP